MLNVNLHFCTKILLQVRFSSHLVCLSQDFHQLQSKHPRLRGRNDDPGMASSAAMTDTRVAAAPAPIRHCLDQLVSRPDSTGRRSAAWATVAEATSRSQMPFRNSDRGGKPVSAVSDPLNACLDVNGTYICTAFNPRCYIIQKVSGNRSIWKEVTYTIGDCVDLVNVNVSMCFAILR